MGSVCATVLACLGAATAEPASHGSAKSSRELQELRSRITILEKELAQYAAHLKDPTLKFEQVQKS